jgi:transcriptional regulator with PAS, ATPase and Fis domain
MNNIKGFYSFNEKKEELKHKALSKEIKDLKKKRDQLLVVRPKKEKDADIIKLNKEIDNIEKDYKKELKSIKENHDGGIQNYMFFGNLKTIKRLVDEMLEMDEAEVDAMLTNGHNWALDHIATSKDDVEEVFNFLAGHSDEHEEVHHEEEHEEKPLLGGPESSHTVHDNHMREMEKSEGGEEKNIKGFEDFQ